MSAFIYTILQICDYIFAKLTNCKILFLVKRGYLISVFHLLSGKRKLRQFDKCLLSPLWSSVNQGGAGASNVNRQKRSQIDWDFPSPHHRSKLQLACYLLIFQIIVNKCLLSLKYKEITMKLESWSQGENILKQWLFNLTASVSLKGLLKQGCATSKFSNLVGLELCPRSCILTLSRVRSWWYWFCDYTLKKCCSRNIKL